MGLRGPAPKPTAVKKLEGNPGKRPLNSREPQPGAGAPKCPPHLDDDAKREWRRLVPILTRMKVLTEADYISLANLCQAYSTMVRAQMKLNESGLLLKTPSGYVQQSPLLSIVNGCVDTIKKLQASGRTVGVPSTALRVQSRSHAARQFLRRTLAQ